MALPSQCNGHPKSSPRPTHWARGMCVNHYLRWEYTRLKHGEAAANRFLKEIGCTPEEVKRARLAHGKATKSATPAEVKATQTSAAAEPEAKQSKKE